MTATPGTFVLTNEDHHYHPLNVEHSHTERPKFTEDGFTLPLDKLKDAKVTCVICNSRLMEGEDYLIQEPEPWQKQADGEKV